jgi:hypothetical protein
MEGQGLDTLMVQFEGPAELSDWTENLLLQGWNSTVGIGNSLDNVLIAGEVGAVLDGRGGDDVLVGGSGADHFVISAGNGSDAIYGFTPHVDTISLQGFEIDSFEDLVSRVTQVGNDLHLGFANGEILILRNALLSGIDASTFGFALPPPAPESSTIGLDGPGSFYTNFGWVVQTNVWNPGNLRYGIDYQIGGSLSSSDLTSDTVFSWAFPYALQGELAVRAYPAVIYGYSPFVGGNSTDTARLFPVKLTDIDALSATYDVSIAGTTSGFNVAFDIWMTSGPGGPITNEVMIWVHTGRFTPGGVKVADIEVGGLPASVYHAASEHHPGGYTAVAFDEQVLAANLDLKAVLDALVAGGFVSESEYVSQIEFGAEVVSGVGSLTIRDFDLNLSTSDPGGRLTHNTITGAGAEAPKFEGPAREVAAASAEKLTASR